MSKAEIGVVFGFVFAFALSLTGWTAFQVGYDDGLRKPIKITPTPWTELAVYGFKGTFDE